MIPLSLQSLDGNEAVTVINNSIDDIRALQTIPFEAKRSSFSPYLVGTGLAKNYKNGQINTLPKIGKTCFGLNFSFRCLLTVVVAFLYVQAYNARTTDRTLGGMSQSTASQD